MAKPQHRHLVSSGTPSLLDERLILDLVEGVADTLDLDVHQLKEVTMEANPEDLKGPKSRLGSKLASTV